MRSIRYNWFRQSNGHKQAAITHYIVLNLSIMEANSGDALVLAMVTGAADQKCLKTGEIGEESIGVCPAAMLQKPLHSRWIRGLGRQNLRTRKSFCYVATSQSQGS
jgi:hypothetical protein